MPLHLRLKSLTRDELTDFLAENLNFLAEDEVLAALDNPNITPQLVGKIAQTARLTGFYAVRVRLVAHRQTPQAHAVKLVHYLYWFDLLRLSTNVQVPSPVRRAIDTQMLNRVEKLSVGEKVTSARSCSQALVKVFLYDPSPRVFEALLLNKRLREDDLLALISSDRASPQQLLMIGDDMRWSFRQQIRKALVLNPRTPRATAATQLRYLSKIERRRIHANPSTSLYVRRCIERLQPDDFGVASDTIDYNAEPDA